MAAVLSHAPAVQFHPLLVAAAADRLWVYLFCFINTTGWVMPNFLELQCEFHAWQFWRPSTQWRHTNFVFCANIDATRGENVPFPDDGYTSSRRLVYLLIRLSHCETGRFVTASFLWQLPGIEAVSLVDCCVPI
jgi:hypothetical protein